MQISTLHFQLAAVSLMKVLDEVIMPLDHTTSVHSLVMSSRNSIYSLRGR